MGILSDFLIGDDDTAKAYDGISAFADEDRCQFRRITPLEAAGILSVLRGGGDSVELIGEFPLLTEEDAEMWTMRVPTDMVTSLAALEGDKLAETASACADATVEELGWSKEDFEPVLRDLHNLALRAQTDQKQMYLWNSL
ncbi:MAG: hypothetical protein R3B84_23140 [Zavarzinella sp.]